SMARPPTSEVCVCSLPAQEAPPICLACSPPIRRCPSSASPSPPTICVVWTRCFPLSRCLRVSPLPPSALATPATLAYSLSASSPPESLRSSPRGAPIRRRLPPPHARRTRPCDDGHGLSLHGEHLAQLVVGIGNGSQVVAHLTWPHLDWLKRDGGGVPEIVAHLPHKTAMPAVGQIGLGRPQHTILLQEPSVHVAPYLSKPARLYGEHAR